MKFAVIETGGKQYRVSPGQRIRIEKIAAGKEGALAFDRVLMRVDGEKMEIGTPYVSGAKVEGKVVREGRERKKIVFKYHSKTRYRRKKGHRQHFAEVEIIKV